MSHEQTLSLTLNVQSDTPMSRQQMLKALTDMLALGQAKALEEGAVNLANLTLSEAVADTMPRVLVVVQDGVVDSVADAGIDVEVFDWDNYNDDPQGTGGVPERFEDLAKQCAVPVGPGSDAEHSDQAVLISASTVVTSEISP